MEFPALSSSEFVQSCYGFMSEDNFLSLRLGFPHSDVISSSKFRNRPLAIEEGEEQPLILLFDGLTELLDCDRFALRQAVVLRRGLN